METTTMKRLLIILMACILSLTISTSIYGAGEELDGIKQNTVSNEAYDESTWNGVEGVAPSKNAVRDKIEAMSAGHTEEEIEDFVGGMLGGTETLITVTYQDDTNDIDFVIDDTDLTNLTTPTAWRMFYSDAADPFIQEIVLGANGTFLESNGASAAPAFRALAAGDIPDISATYQPLDDELTDVAGLTFADDKIILGTGAGTIAMADCSAYAQTILDDADAATARTTLELVIGTDVEAHDTTLTDIADGTIAENLVNTANPWADNEVADNISISNVAQFIDGGANPIDGDKIEITATWDNITPDTGIAQADSADDLAAILEGIDDALGGAVGSTLTINVTAQTCGEDDATPDVSNAADGQDNVYYTNSANATTITDFDDGDDHSDFADGDWFILVIDDANTKIDFSANANIEGNAGVDFTGSAAQIVQILFVWDNTNTHWNAVNMQGGYSSPTVFAPSSVNMADGVVALPCGANPTTDADGEIALDESDGGQGPLFLEAYDDGVGNCSRIIGSDTHCESFTILEPDSAVSVEPNIPLKQFVAEGYPFGVTLVSIHVGTDGTDVTDDTINFERWTGEDDGTPDTMENIGFGGGDNAEDDGTIANNPVADDYLVADITGWDDDIPLLIITICYRITPGD